MRTSVAVLFTLLVPLLAGAFDVPPNDGFVTDMANVLTADQDAALEGLLAGYQKETTNEIAVLIVDSLKGEDSADVTVEVGRKWGVGTSEDDNGILMLVSYGDREVFIATGYGLEGAVPDVVSKGIIEEDILPQFREGAYYDGILAGIEALKKHIGGEYTAERYSSPDASGAAPFVLFFLFIVLDYLAALFGRTRSWWLGGVVGGIFGVILAAWFAWWLTIPILVLIGLLFDYTVSRTYQGRSRTRFFGGRFGPGGHLGGGGFGGFSGGSFGGGGARGRW
jgi:uncharacterized protein